MKSKRLTPEEEAVLDAIITQRSESWTDEFEYDYMRAQTYIAEKGAFMKYGLDLYRQFEILENFSKNHVITISECIVRPTGSKPSSFMSLMEWARECWNTTVEQGPGTADANRCTIFIKMSQDDAKYINNNYRVAHKVWLKVEKTQPHLSIKIDGEGWKVISRLHDDRLPIRVLRYAYTNHGKIVSRDVLAKECDTRIIGKSLTTQVFSDNNAVKSLSPLLIKLETDSIMFKVAPVKLTPTELNKLKVDLKIS